MSWFNSNCCFGVPGLGIHGVLSHMGSVGVYRHDCWPPSGKRQCAFWWELPGDPSGSLQVAGTDSDAYAVSAHSQEWRHGRIRGGGVGVGATHLI